MFNKPSFKFKKDDVFLSYLKANPTFKIHYYYNKVKINNGLDMDPSLYETDTTSVYENCHSGSIIYPFFIKDQDNPLHFFTDEKSLEDWSALAPGEIYSGSYILVTSSLSKEYIIKTGTPASASIIPGVTEQSTINKLGSLKNVYNYYRYLSPLFDFDTYLAENDGQVNEDNYVVPVPETMSFIEIPRLYKGNKVKEGSLKLSFYYTGSLVAKAEDVKKNGIIYETTGSHVGQAIGTILYPEGLIVLTASYSLNDLVQDGYLCPKTVPDPETLDAEWKDNPKWVHFMSYQSYITKSSPANSQSYAPTSSSYTIEFKGETVVPTYTMLCHADKNDLVWSNNPTFVAKNEMNTYKDMYVLSTGSQHYEEKKLVPIKNIVSGSFNNYSESFSPVTYISKIGIYDKEGDLIAVANLSNPVKKTTEQDYTFKLKLDL